MKFKETKIQGTFVITPEKKKDVRGSFARVWKLFEFASRHNILCVLSSTFDSGLGLSVISKLASFAPFSVAHGLATHHWLKTDVIVPPFRAFRGFVNDCHTSYDVPKNISVI